MSKNKIISSAIILSLSGIIAKLFSAFFRIPLWYIIGDAGMGAYQTLYPLLLLVMGIMGAGYQSYMAREIAMKSSEIDTYPLLERLKAFKKLGWLLTVIFSVVSVAVFGGLWYLGEPIDSLFLVGAAFVGFAFIPYFGAQNGLLKAFFQGQEQMKPVGYAGIIESLGKFVLGIGGAFILLKITGSVVYALLGAAIGTGCGFLLSNLYLLTSTKGYKKVESGVWGDIAWKEMTVAIIPITLLMMNHTLLNTIDSLAVLYLNPRGPMLNGLSPIELVGQMGKAYSVVNFPLTIGVALIMSVIPSLSKKYTDKQEAGELGFLLGTLIGFPAGMGLIVLGKPIMAFLYQNSTGYESLIAYGFTLLLVIPLQGIIGFLISQNKLKKLVLAFLVSIGLKVLLMFGISWYHQGQLSPFEAILTSLICFVTLVIVGIKEMKEHKIQLKIGKTVGKPLLSSLVMGGFVFSLMSLFSNRHNNSVILIFVICVGALLYSLLIIKFKVIDFKLLKKDRNKYE